MTTREMQSLLIDAIYTNGEDVKEVRRVVSIERRGLDIEFTDGRVIEIAIKVSK